MKSIKLATRWRNGVWHNLFKADNELTFDIANNCLLDDFCDYCGYTIEEQIDASTIVISGPIRLLISTPKLRLSIAIQGDKFIATYKLVSMPFVSLAVAFREEDTRLVVDDDLQSANVVTRVLYQPIADRFVSNGAAAMEQFLNKL